MQIKDLPSNNTLSSTDVFAKDTSGGITEKITGAALAEQLQGLGNYLDTADVYNGLDKSSAGFVLDARQGKALEDKKLDKANVYNGLDKDVSGYALDARQGKALEGTKLDKTVIAPVESSTTASRAYTVGEYFILNGTMYVATAAIASGGTITVGTNCRAAMVGDEVSDLKSAFDKVTTTTENLFDDAYALKHAADVMLENGAFVGSVTAFGDFVLLPHGSFETGKTYTISFDAMESGTGATGKLGIFLKTESGGNVSYDVLNADNSTWHHYSFTYTFADTVYYVRFGRANTTTNTWYIKNIVINAGSAEIPYVQHLTAYDLIARKANEAISKYSLAYDLYPTGDTTKRGAEILTVLTEKGLCRLAPGEYYVNYLQMPKGTALIGAGIGKTKIIKDGSEPSYTVRLKEECEIGNMTLSGYPNDIVAPETLGSGRVGVRIQGVGSDNTQRFHCTIHDMEIINCDYAGVSIYGTGYSPESGCHLHNLYIRQCGYGIFLSSYAEFHIISDVNATYCTCGVGNYGGNNTFTGFNLSRNAIGVLMDNTSDNYPNNAHGAFTGGSINHNSEYAIKMIKTIAGQIFSAINIFDNGIYVDDCTGVHFDTLNCGSSAPVVLNGSQPVFFTNCIFMANASPISGDNTPIIVNCYTRGGAAWGA